MSKTVGEVFDLVVPNECRNRLLQVARLATHAENSMWRACFRRDPIDEVKAAEIFAYKNRTGKWPEIPVCDFQLGPIAAALCADQLKSYIYDNIRQIVETAYRRDRFKYLAFAKRIPWSHHLRIRFRDGTCALIKEGDWFKVVCKFEQQGEIVLPIKCRGRSEYTMGWLEECADPNNPEYLSGGTISRERRGGKWSWKISFTRCRRVGERPKIRRPVKGRYLSVSAPPEQDVFLRLQVFPVTGKRPWVETIDGNDIAVERRQYASRRQLYGRNFHQSPLSAARGHGHYRRDRPNDKFEGRYKRKVQDWIENRSRAIVNFAIRTHCGVIKMEDLCQRDPMSLIPGPFQYFILLDRTKAKAIEHGIKFVKSKCDPGLIFEMEDDA